MMRIGRFTWIHRLKLRAFVLGLAEINVGVLNRDALKLHSNQ